MPRPMRTNLSLTPEQQQTLRQWIPLAYKLSRAKARMMAGRIDADEFDSAAMIGLINAVQTFNPNRGIKFTTYAHKCISNRLKHPVLHFWSDREQFSYAM